jgi:hypothetical protein
MIDCLDRGRGGAPIGDAAVDVAIVDLNWRRHRHRVIESVGAVHATDRQRSSRPTTPEFEAACGNAAPTISSTTTQFGAVEDVLQSIQRSRH